MIGYYYLTFAVSVLLTVLYVAKWHKHYNIYLTILFGIIPVTSLAVLQLALSGTKEAALGAYSFITLGHIFIGLCYMLASLNLCRVTVSNRVATILFSMAFLISALIPLGVVVPALRIAGSIEKKYGITVLNVQHGYMYAVTAVWFLCTTLAVFFVLIRSLIKRDVSRRIIFSLLITTGLNLMSLIAAPRLLGGVDVSPLCFAINQGILLYLIDTFCLYEIEDTIIDTIIQNNDIGYVSLDFNRRFLGCNDVALRFLPVLSNLHVDDELPTEGDPYEMIQEWIREVDSRKVPSDFKITRNHKSYKVTISYLYNHHKVRGYQLRMRDNTREEQYLNLVNNYSTALAEEVDAKTKELKEIQDKLVLGMANMVDNRDNSTGGHIKRTSEVVRILIEAMQEDEYLDLDPKFCAAVIKAAPMHDLGKIAVDDDILKKPGRYTEEEFDIMKTHTTKGAEIVQQILAGAEEPYFVKIAENVAHYHHEKFDGTGYPEGLFGNEIPYEARIMAIADTYDALVSRRCYKESMSFDEVFAIIEDGMGSHFDGTLNPYFCRCREKLEAYYREQMK